MYKLMTAEIKLPCSGFSVVSFVLARLEYRKLTLSIRTKSQNFSKQIIRVKTSSREIRLVKQVAFTLPF